MLTLIAITLAAAAVTDSPPASDPAAAIGRGKVRCGWPDVARKTCRSFARYTRMAGGMLDIAVEGLPGETGLVLHYRSRGRINHDLLCITITNDDVARATFTKSGVTLIGSAQEKARDGMREAYATLLGHEICDRDDAPDRDGVSASISLIDGQPDHELDRTVKWVDVRDGYVLGPLPHDLA